MTVQVARSGCRPRHVHSESGRSAGACDRRNTGRHPRGGYRLSAPADRVPGVDRAPVADRVPVVVLISGRGSNMRTLVERSSDPRMGYRVAAVLSDRPDAAGLAVATGLGVPARALPAPGRGASAAARIAYDAELAAAIGEVQAVPARTRRIHAHSVAGVRGALRRPRLEHPSLAPAQIPGPRYASPGAGRSRRGARRNGAFRDSPSSTAARPSSRASWR